FPESAALRHSQRTNMVFADGHTKSIGWEQLLDRKADDVAPWMVKWLDCDGGCTPLKSDPLVGPGKCFDPTRLR
ncbi:MAG: hypothetical protein H7145_10470, partial [Akkermansiaceae bacterium]|nr:hypothetical protein [Armatimonadota bacterium]